MSLSVGIVGLPNVGKSTLFNALTKKSVPAENYPFCTIDPAIGIVAVPDGRLHSLSKLSQSQETLPAVVEFVDIAGLVKGASKGEGLGNQFLSNIRETDLILEVVRIFEDSDVHHVAGVIDPVSDIETINYELIMADVETVVKRLNNLEKDLKRGDKTAQEEAALLTRVQTTLNEGRLANSIDLNEEELELIKSLHLLTIKPVLYACNRQNGAYNLDEQADERWQALVEYFDRTEAEYLVIDAGIEHDLKDLDPEEKNEFRREYGTQDSGVDALIRACYNRLGLISYFTSGEKETRAWTVPQGSTGPEAGAAIHSDFRDKYIRAQVVTFDDLIECGSLKQARDEGKLRLEGREYIVRDGDVIEFKI